MTKIIITLLYSIYDGERCMYNNKKTTYYITKYHRNYYWLRVRVHQTLIAVNLPIALNGSNRFDLFFELFFIQDKQLVYTLIPIFTSIVSSISECITSCMYTYTFTYIHVYAYACMYVYHDPLTEARHGIAQQPCIWQYLTCFRKRSLVTEMRSRSDNSHVEYYTLQELASVLISQLVCSCSRRHVYLFPLPHSISPSPSLILVLCPPPLFVTFVLYTLCPRFDSFDSFAMERENATVREKPLANDVKVRSAGRIWDRQKFLSCSVVMYARTSLYELSIRTHTRSQYVFITGGSLAKLLRIHVARHWWNSLVHFCGLETLVAWIREQCRLFTRRDNHFRIINASNYT